jgi:hypothetical protein
MELAQDRVQLRAFVLAMLKLLHHRQGIRMPARDNLSHKERQTYKRRRCEIVSLRHITHCEVKNIVDEV